MMIRILLALSVVVVLSSTPPTFATLSPQAISPGGLQSPAAVSVRCPTFTWAPGEGATELVLYDLEAGSSEVLMQSIALAPATPRVRIELPARASSWSASGSRCLPPGLYAWTVGSMGEGEKTWSKPLLLEIQAPTTLNAATAGVDSPRRRSMGSRQPATGTSDENLAVDAPSDAPSGAAAVDYSAVTIDSAGVVFASGFVQQCANGTTFYRDSDTDGYGDPAQMLTACSAMGGYVTNQDDFDDTDDTLHPEDTDLSCDDGIDNDSDTFIDCIDFDCNCATVCGGPGCDCLPEGSETGEAECSDNFDNDCDDFSDCNDFDCTSCTFCGGPGC